MKKKVVAIALTALMAVALAACGGKSDEASSAAASSAAASSAAASSAASEAAPAADGQTYQVGIINCNDVYPYYQAEIDGMVKMADELKESEGVTFEFTRLDSQDDVNREMGNVETLISQGVDAILLINISEQDGDACVKAASEAGIPTVVVSRKVSENCDPLFMNVTDYAQTKAGAEWFLENVVGGEGVICEIQGNLGNANVTMRHDSLEEALADYPNITLADSQTAEFDAAKAGNIAADMISANPDLKAFYVHNDDMASGVISSVEAAGKTGEIAVYGIDGEPQALKRIKEGTQTATLGVPIALEGARSVYYLYQALIGNDYPEKIETEMIPIDSSNIDEYSETLWSDIHFADYDVVVD